MNEAKKRTWREWATTVGFVFVIVSCSSMFGVIAYFVTAQLGYWREYEISAVWGAFMWPLSLLALIFAILGKGKTGSRIVLAIASCILLLGWTTAFIH